VHRPMTDPTFAALAAISHWSNKKELVQFALDRHGYADSNGGFGITYPGDLDEYDRIVEGVSIPEGFVQAYGFWGPPEGYALLVEEWRYRDVLAEVLECLGLWQEAANVRTNDGWLGRA